MLNAGQESAARLLLASRDRVVNVQGVAGAGKSSALGAVADVARTAGHKVLALGVANEPLLNLTRDSGIASVSIAKFLRTHEKLLLDKTFVERLDHARDALKNAVLIVDGASMASKVSMTREEERHARKYTVGQTVEIARDLLKQGIERGRGKITGVDGKAGIVEITRANGRVDRLKPAELAMNRADDSFELSNPRELTIYEGDTIRWTANDTKIGIANSAKAKVTAITTDTVTLLSATGQPLTLAGNSDMLQRLDLGYAMNAHMNQGVTADRAIGVIDSPETNLTNGRLFLVQITRVRDGLELIVSDRSRVEQALVHNRADKSSALETIAAIVPARFPDQPPVTAAGRLAAKAARAAQAVIVGKQATHDPTAVSTLERTREKQLDFGL